MGTGRDGRCQWAASKVPKPPGSGLPPQPAFPRAPLPGISCQAPPTHVLPVRGPLTRGSLTCLGPTLPTERDLPDTERSVEELGPSPGKETCGEAPRRCRGRAGAAAGGVQGCRGAEGHAQECPGSQPRAHRTFYREAGRMRPGAQTVLRRRPTRRQRPRQPPAHAHAAAAAP